MATGRMPGDEALVQTERKLASMEKQVRSDDALQALKVKMGLAPASPPPAPPVEQTPPPAQPLATGQAPSAVAGTATPPAQTPLPAPTTEQETPPEQAQVPADEVPNVPEATNPGSAGTN